MFQRVASIVIPVQLSLLLEDSNEARFEDLDRQRPHDPFNRILIRVQLQKRRHQHHALVLQPLKHPSFDRCRTTLLSPVPLLAAAHNRIRPLISALVVTLVSGRPRIFVRRRKRRFVFIFFRFLLLLHVQKGGCDFQEGAVDYVLLVLFARALNELRQSLQRIHNHLETVPLEIRLESIQQIDHRLDDIVVVAGIELMPKVVLNLEVMALAH